MFWLELYCLFTEETTESGLKVYRDCLEVLDLLGLALLHLFLSLAISHSFLATAV